MEILSKATALTHFEFYNDISVSGNEGTEETLFQLSKKDNLFYYSINIKTYIPNENFDFALNVKSESVFEIDMHNTNPEKMELFALYTIAHIETKSAIVKKLEIIGVVYGIQWEPYLTEKINNAIVKSIEIFKDQLNEH